MTTIAMEEYELMKESKYRMYVAAVDKALKNFEYTSEWADLISALGKLNKVLMAYTKYPVIPRRIKISKRLAQCMHPALPSGVHLKALETYDIIFKCMGTNRLTHELFIYSAGLFPLFGHAAMTIRPILLQLYETHFVPLRERLRPALSGFLSGMLQGLENGSDHFDRTNALLEAVCEGVGPKWYYTCVWQCVRSNSLIRLPAISYVLSHYSRKLTMEDQDYLMGLDIDVMVCGLCAAVQDSSVLVQRAALDLLMACFPMHNTQLLYADMVRLVTAALSTILRRDMSLNRRLYSWLLGTEVNVNLLHSDHPLIKKINAIESHNHADAYFELFSFDILIEAIRVTLHQSTMETPIDVKPYRLLTSLFDKPQIGPIILDNVLYDVFRALYLTCQHQQRQSASNGRCVAFNGDPTSLHHADDANGKFALTKHCPELIKNANLLFNTLEPYYIWLYVGKLYADALAHVRLSKKHGEAAHVEPIGSAQSNPLEICLLTEFLLDVVTLETYADHMSATLPNLFVEIVTIARDHMHLLNRNELAASVRMCTSILAKIQPCACAPPAAKVAVALVADTCEITAELGEESAASDGKAMHKESESAEVRIGLEKSKSDSRINENVTRNELTIEEARERSNSNQMLLRKQKTSPRIEKKTKNKKSKSSSKLYELKKDEEANVEEEAMSEMKLDAIEDGTIVHVVNNALETSAVENKHILRCLRVYKEFYISFLREKILCAVDVDAFFGALMHDSEARVRTLEQLLAQCLDGACAAREERAEDALAHDVRQLRATASMSTWTISEYHAAMTLSSNLLLEFAAYANLIDDDDDDDDGMPVWLRTLIVTACGTETAHDVRMIAMTTMLELFSMAKGQSLQAEQHEGSSNTMINMGIVQYKHVCCVEERTCVVEIMSHNLWEMLGVLNNQEQLIQCVTLLYNIHNIFDTRYFVEDVIAQYLIKDNLTVEFFKRFSLLWHLGRNIDIKIPGHQANARNFDRSLLKILDNLESKSGSTMRLLTETFLTHTLVRNDIARLLNPLLAMLLIPSTARISIRHINIYNADLPTDPTMQPLHPIDEAKYRKIYAISSVDGNIMYHITDEHTKPAKRKSFLFSKAGRKTVGGPGACAVNVTASISTDSQHVVTKKNKDFKNVDASPNLDRAGKNNMKLFVNPLGAAKEIYPDGVIGSYTKIFDSIEQSSSESLSSNDLTQASNDSLGKMLRHGEILSLNLDRDSGFESQNDSLLRNCEDTSTANNNSIERPNNNFFAQLDPIVTDGVASNKTHARHMLKSHSFDGQQTAQARDDLENALVHSWSYCLSDSDKVEGAAGELEVSTPADEFFHGDDATIIHELLAEILDRVCHVEAINRHVKMARFTEIVAIKPKMMDHGGKNFTVYPIHYHVCLYYDVYDSNLILYALRTLKASLAVNAQLFVQCMATNGVASARNNEILYALTRHRKSILGGGYAGEVGAEQINFYRGYMFLDTMITVCLNFARSFYPSLDNKKLTRTEIDNNLRVQLISLEVLDMIVRSLIGIVGESGRGFASYIADMLVRCKLQKILLHCLLTSVRNFDKEMTFAEEVLLFNGFQLYDGRKRVSEHIEAFQVQLLRLIQSLIILEHHVFPAHADITLPNTNATTATTTTTPSNGEHLTYAPTVLIPDQQMFLSAILSALRHRNMKSLHEQWCTMVTSCLPYFGPNLKQITLSVIHQLCSNIETLAEHYRNATVHGALCPDYVTSQLSALTYLCHYCLLDSTQGAASALSASNATAMTSSSAAAAATNTTATATTPTTNPTELLNNLVSAFFTQNANDASAAAHSHKHNSNHYQSARKTILSHMPRIISSVAKLWQTIVAAETDYVGVLGNAKMVRQQLLEFLSPIAIHHSASFVAAIAVAWFERRTLIRNAKTVLPEPNAAQTNLVYLISAIRVIPLDNLVQTVTAVIRNPPPTEGLSADICLDVSVLELFYCYMCNASATQLSEAWTSLLTLVREGCSLTPPAQFLLAALLHELMIKCCPLDERKEQKDLQDVTAKLIEGVSQVCGACLEQTTWLRRNLAVRESEDEVGVTMVGVGVASATEMVAGSNYSVQAQLVLSEILAPILDICFGSSEKDKVNTILISLMYNIVPYLKTHTMKNMSSFHACSKLVASLSSYQYTRKAWKKDVFDLLLDNALFQMDYACLKYWKIIIDNLMTHDNTTFRDLMSRVSMTQSGSLSIFSSREQEYEQKAQLLKRLAFVIFCSETDQYAKYMPDIQEQLNSSLRLNVPVIHTQVFLCFRVLLIRMTSMHVTSLWPIVISEMLQVFLQIEQQFLTETEEFRTNNSAHIKFLSTLDASWATNSSNGLHAQGNPHWLRLQLATCKLLDLVLLLPATSLPQFQMYRWAFVEDDLTHVKANGRDRDLVFVPHITRIAHLMDQRFADSQIETLPTRQNELLLVMTSIAQLKDLHSFFKTLSLCANRHRTECSSGAMSSEHSLHERQVDRKLGAILEKIDRVVEMDFLDKVPR